MDDGKRRLLASGRIRAIIGEAGVEVLEIGGKRFEGFDSYVPVPLRDLRYIRIEEIPEGVYIEPVEAVEGNTVYLANLGTMFPYELRYWSRGVEVELNMWPGDWDSYVSLSAYMDGLASVLELLEKWGFVDGVDEEYTGDMYHVEFTVPLPGDMTLLKGLSLVKRMLREVEKAARRLAHALVLLEIEDDLGGYDSKSLLEKLDSLFGRYGV